MAKTCGICGKKLTIFTITSDIKPGKICIDCFGAISHYRYEKLGESSLELFQDGYTWEDAKREFAESKEYARKKDEDNKLAIKKVQKTVKDFRATSSFDTVHFNDNTNLILVEISDTETEVFQYDQIIGFELIENGNSIISGGIGRAVAGGILFGEVGAVVGGTTATRKMKELCTLLKIKITFRNCERKSFDITLFDSSNGLQKQSNEYRVKYDLAEEIITALQVAVDKVKKIEESSTNFVFSPADEILKYKNLMDVGIITEEEFEAKKKQLLGLWVLIGSAI